MRRVVVAALATTVLLVGCGGDTAETTDDDPVLGRDPATEPDAGDPEAVEPYLEDLLAEHDRLVAEIVADPSVVEDPDHGLVGQYVDLFEPGSPLPQQVIDAWVADHAAGITVQPYDDQHPLVTTTIDGEIEVVDPDEVVVPACQVRRERVSVHGELTRGVPERAEPVEVSAVRVDGHWRLRTRAVVPDGSCD